MIDCVVIGYGLVGLVCATQLRALGHHVGLAFNAYDTCSAEGIWEVPATVINEAPERGEVLIERLRGQLDELGFEWLDTVGSLSCVDDRVQIGDPWDTELATARLAIVCPVGTETVALPGFEGEPRQYVSTDAWSDASLFADNPVVVVGSGWRAASEALFAASKRAHVTLICAEQTLHALALGEHVRACPRITLVEGATIVGPVTHASTLHGVLVRGRDGVVAEIPARLVFSALGVSWDWQLFGSEEAGRACVDSSLVHLAGLAAGLPDWDLAAQLRHAEQLVARVDGRLRG